ncbi:hypothetical protein KIN20_011171 [Parelaphostrongylus tenuis]|uniref:PAP-associated domain-containing protein n=1 Tax=Parelaphostrongylus tenuis TaxID=148309 RepID=A0AAD5MDN9_PARTN|nr:hypothetical protein KIN20_011171 [Parelaphostrongylus tenuis]
MLILAAVQSHMYQEYRIAFSFVDTRCGICDLQPLCTLVKEWAANNGVKNTTDGGFNSYALVLLVIHLLQSVASPPILPSLQKLFPDKYARNVNGEIRFPMDVDFDDESFPDGGPEIESNSLTVAELFVSFLYYYSNFNFDRYYICMRDAAMKPRNGQDDGPANVSGNSVFIRDPIDDHNPGRTVRDIKFLQTKMRKTLHLFNSVDHIPVYR